MKAFVSGGTGFIGSRVCCDLVEKGYKVFVLARGGQSKNEKFNSYVASGDIEIIIGDIKNVDISTLPEVDYIYHIAGKVAVWGDYSDFAQTNVCGTKLMLEYAKNNANLKCFIYFSSVAVYGFYGYQDLKEGAEFAPMQNPYPLSKVVAEKQVKDFAEKEKINYIIVRPGNVYGEFDYTSSYDIYKRVKKQSMMICGGGKYKSCFVYVGNLSAAAIHLAENKDAHNTDYNLTDGNDLTLYEVLSLVAKEFNVKNKFISFPAWLSRVVAWCIEKFYKLFKIKKAPLITRFTVEQNLHDYSFSFEKTLNTGFSLPYTTEQGIQNTVKWFNSLPINEQK